MPSIWLRANCGTGFGGFEAGNRCAVGRAPQGQGTWSGGGASGGAKTTTGVKVNSPPPAASVPKFQRDENLSDSANSARFIQFKLETDGHSQGVVKAAKFLAKAVKTGRSDETVFRISDKMDRYLKKKYRGRRNEEMSDAWKSVSRSINGEAFLNILANCGTGAGGFQPGNKCGGGSSAGGSRSESRRSLFRKRRGLTLREWAFGTTEAMPAPPKHKKPSFRELTYGSGEVEPGWRNYDRPSLKQIIFG